MNAKLKSVILLALIAASGMAWGQSQGPREIVIEPPNPSSSDVITLSIKNSVCWSFARIDKDFEHHHIGIYLTYFQSNCLDPAPEATDFKTTIGPLEVGDYQVVYTELLQGSLAIRGDEKSFSVGVLRGGAINGLYYSPNGDGHYIYVIDTDYTTMVVWTTFDAAGNQAWVYGLGYVDAGNHILADAYINSVAGISSDGETQGFSYQYWGQVELTLTSCLEGDFKYTSDLPNFGSGEFAITRIGYVKQVGCGNR